MCSIKLEIKTHRKSSTEFSCNWIFNVIRCFRLFSEVVFNNSYKIRTEILIDNKSLYESLFSKKNIIEKCLRIHIAFTKENIKNQIISKVHLVSDLSLNQLANKLTKKGASSIDFFNVLKSGIIQSFTFRFSKKIVQKSQKNIYK